MQSPEKIVESHQRQKENEHILVVKRSHLFVNGDWQGLSQQNFDHYLHIINHKKEFHPRALMETDSRYKQIIPYLVFTHNDKYFLMQRSAESFESRLHNKVTLGIGGHIRQEDLDSSSLYGWATREFHEEVNYAGNVTVKNLGIINDDSNDVGKVHIGFVLLLIGDSPAISIKSELKHGALISLDECYAQRNVMEAWSQYVIDFLVNSGNQSV